MLKKEGSIFEKISFAVMTRKRIKTIWLSLLMIPLIAAGSSPLKFALKPNGLAIFFIASDQPSTLSFCFQAGTQYETDSFPGLARLAHEILAIKCRNNTQLNTAGLKTSFSKDLSSFHFNNIPSPKIQGTIAEFIRLLTSADISEDIIREACEAILQEEKNVLEDSQYRLPLYYLKKLYGSNYLSVYPYGAYLVSPDINPRIIQRFITNIYTPYHCALTYQSASASDFDLISQLNEWDNWRKTLFNYESINRYIDFKRIVKSTQKVFLQADSTRLEYVFLLPGVAGVEQKGLEMFALNLLIRNYIQRFAPIETSLELHAFDTRFTVTLHCLPEHIDSFHPLIVSGFRDFYQKIPETGYSQAIQDAIGERDLIRQTQPDKYLALAARTTRLSNSFFMQQLEDSLQFVNTKKLYLFAAEYISQGDFISTLHTDSLSYGQYRMDSVFSDADESTIQLSIPFTRNSYMLSEKEHYPYLYKLEQWAKLNPELLIQINAFSDSREYNKAYDDSMMEFMDSLPNFKRIMPEIIKKRYLSLEMMRSMQILRWLYSKGIPADRLSGTCQRIKSKQRAEEENMRCTATFPAVRNPVVNYQQVQFAKP